MLMRVIVWSKMDYLKNVKLCNSFEQNSMHQRIVSKIETDAKINFLRITNPFPISQCHSNDVGGGCMVCTIVRHAQAWV